MTTINGNYREFKLDNGLLVALQDTPTQTVSGRLRVWHGSLNEQPGEEGIAHFLEHTLLSGGSSKYTPEQSNKIMGTFGFFNAYTGLQKTFFPVDMLAEDTELFLNYISDAAFNPIFDKIKVEEERQRVLRETSDAKSNYLFKERRAYDDALFGKDSPHTYFGLGNEEVISSVSIKDLENFHQRGYNPNNMDLILVGALPKNIEQLIKENFSSFKSGVGKKVEFTRNPQLTGTTIFHNYAPELLNNENPEQSSAQLSISFVAPTSTDEDSYAASMLVDILGGDANSRLFTSVSQKKGLAYGISSQYSNGNNKGIIDIIFEEMNKLKTELVSQEELDRLKRNSQYRIAKTFETNAGHVAAIEKKIDTGLTPEYHLEKMGAVTPEKIRDAAIKYFPTNRSEGKYVLGLRDPLKK